MKALADLGVRVEITKNTHYKVYCPLGVVFIPSTPGEYRSVKNNVSELRKYGIDF